MNLLDTIRQSTQKQGMTDETQKLQTLLRAKSGRAVAPSSAATSAVQEQAANDATNSQLQQIDSNAYIANQAQQQQARGIEQQTANTTAQVEQSRRFNDLQSRIETDKLLSDLERNKGQIDMDRDSARVEQVAQGLRLQNKKYIEDLQRESAKARLLDGNEFQLQLQKDIFGENTDLLKEQLGNKEILDLDDREFNRLLTQMGVDDAWRVHQNELDTQRKRALTSFIGQTPGLVGGAMSAGGSRAPAQQTNMNQAQTSTPVGSNNSYSNYT